MELKRVLGQDNQSAAAIAVNLYGKDALIVSNERVNGRVELIVAVDLNGIDDPLPQDAVKELPGNDAAPRVSVADSGVENFKNILKERFVEQSIQQLPGPVSDTNAEVASDGDELAKAKDLVEMLRLQFAEIREELRDFRNSGGANRGAEAREEHRPIAQALTDANVPHALRTKILEEIRGARDLPKAIASTEAFLMRSIRREKCPPRLGGIHVISGPSGAGKSMMIGRLAALHTKDGVYSADDVAILSFKDRRPGAWNQIQLIGAQTGVETFRAHDEESLKSLLQELGCRKLILIDTPSLGFADHIQAIKSLNSSVHFNLLLPADASVATIRRHLAESPNWYSLMLSKVDESTQPWPMIQALTETKLPISYSAKSALLDGLFTEPSTDILVSLAMRHLPIPREIANIRQKSGISNAKPLIQSLNS